MEEILGKAVAAVVARSPHRSHSHCSLRSRTSPMEASGWTHTSLRTGQQRLARVVAAVAAVAARSPHRSRSHCSLRSRTSPMEASG